jgi:two-component system sensor histidine kinase ArlS
VGIRFNIRQRIVVIFILFFIVLMVAYIVFVLGSYNVYREQSYYGRLKQNAGYLSYKIILASTSNQSIQDVFVSENVGLFRLLPSQGIIILDPKNDTLYAYNPLTFPNYTLTQLRRLKDATANQNDTQFIAFEYLEKGKQYMVLAHGYNEAGIERLNMLRKYSLYYVLAVSLLIAIIGYYYSGYVLRPLRLMLQTIDEIADNNLHKRIKTSDSNDELDKLAHNFNEMLDRIQNSFELEKRFVANTSHEYRTPLTAIKGQIDVALMNERTTEYYKRLLNSINDDIDRLVGLQTALSDLVKAKRQPNKDNFKYVPFIEIAAEAKSYAQDAHPNYTIELYVNDYPENIDKSIVHADPMLMQSAIINLIDNACKFSNNKTARVVITFHESYIQLKVSDEGTGISTHDLPHIFDPFYRSADRATTKGYGIGLSLVKRIAEIHQITIDVESQEGIGTIFYLKIPHLHSMNQRQEV